MSEIKTICQIAFIHFIYIYNKEKYYEKGEMDKTRGSNTG